MTAAEPGESPGEAVDDIAEPEVMQRPDPSEAEASHDSTSHDDAGSGSEDDGDNDVHAATAAADTDVGEPDADNDPRADEDLDTVIAQRDEYLETLQRLKAEFENVRKRTERERLVMVDRASEDIVRELLPVLDACDAALAHGTTEVQPVQTKMMDVLTRLGLEVVESEGQQFDPTLHEAVLREDGEGESDTIVEVMRQGYLWKGRLLRTAMVKVRS